MATKTIITGYNEITHILPAEILDMDKLQAAGGRVIEEFEVEVERGTKEEPKTETDLLVRISVPADKIDQFGGTAAVDYLAGKWVHNTVEKEDHAITEEVEEPEPEILDAPEVLRDAPELVAATPQKFVAKSDYEGLILATEAATTVKALKEVLSSYFALRAGL